MKIMDIDKIVNIVNNGGVVLIPTDTVYGLVCDATNEMAIRKIYELKKRNYSKPLIVLVSNIEMLKKYTSDICNLEEKLINKYLPGELTIILKKNNLLSDMVTANMDTVGIRIPDNNDLINIINKLGRPIVSTSANVSSREVITNINMLENKIKNDVDYIYDGGYINREASTIIKVQNNRIIILRSGVLSDDIKNNYRRYIKEVKL